MYTRPEHRGEGIASALIQTIISHAKSHLVQLHLTCVTTNLGAMTFYQKHEFKIYGSAHFKLELDPLFFDYHLTELSLVVLIAMDMLVVTIIWLAYKKMRVVSLLMTPYLLWILFASYLNFYIWQYN